ncbi:MAG: HlyC/CorC family transporter [Planctomycetales bacterium]|nr:HlyC/CorC family transporter [Planctomycetales bacterium]
MHNQYSTKRSARFRFLLLASAILAGVMLTQAWGVTPQPKTGGDTGAADTVPEAQHFIMMCVYMGIALGFSFLCSVAEAVALCITPSYLAKLKNEGHRAASSVSSLKGNIDRSLAAILTLNTLAHTIGAGGAGAEAAAYFKNVNLNVIMLVMTLMILFLSEIIPKTIGAVYWRQLGPLTARFVKVLVLSLFPLIWLSEQLTKLLTRGKSHHGFNREEFTALANIGAAGGHFDKRESNILTNLFRFPELRVHDIMTPRTVVFALQQDQTVAEFMNGDPNLTFSRIPVFGENRDDITGFILKSDLLLNFAKEQGRAKLRDIKRDLLIIRDNESLSTALDRLFDQRAHILLVIDQHGGTAGIVTLEDVVETLMGFEIVDEADKDIDMRVVARKKWRQRMEKLGIDLRDASESSGDSPPSDG